MFVVVVVDTDICSIEDYSCILPIVFCRENIPVNRIGGLSGDRLPIVVGVEEEKVLVQCGWFDVESINVKLFEV